MYDKRYNFAHKLTSAVSSKVKWKQEEMNYLVKKIEEKYEKEWRKIKVLDIWCDEWRNTKIIKERLGDKIDLYGIDINKYAISLAKEKNLDINFNVSSEEFTKQHYKDFDFVFSIHVYEHVPDIDGIIKDTVDLTKDDGVLAVIIPQERIRWDLQTIPMFINLFRLKFENPHVAKYTKDDMAKKLEKHGFYIQDFIYTSVFPPYVKKERRIDSIWLSMYFEKKKD